MVFELGETPTGDKQIRLHFCWDVENASNTVTQLKLHWPKEFLVSSKSLLLLGRRVLVWYGKGGGVSGAVHSEVLYVNRTQEGNFELLGAPIGHRDFCRTHVYNKIQDTGPLIHVISQMLYKQSALHLLRHCASYALSTRVHLMFTVLFGLLEGQFELFDEAVKPPW
eukprot:2045417-Amphidinium_carterae.1